MSPGAATQFHPHDGRGQGAAKVIESINIYCTNFERSIRIPQDAGLQGDSRPRRGHDEETHAQLASAARSHVPRRAVLMIFGDNPCSTRIDLIQWKGPDTEGKAHPHLWHAGMCRIALRTRTLMKDYEDLKAKGIEFWTEPIMVKLDNDREEGFVCCTDPDGTVIELIQV